MLNPAIGKLIENSENRYGLVTQIANCARDIASEAEKNEDFQLIVYAFVGKYLFFPKKAFVNYYTQDSSFLYFL